MTQSFEPAQHTLNGLDKAFAALGQAGGWFGASERIAVAQETRAARRCGLCAEQKAALSPYSVSGTHETVSDGLLSPVIQGAIHRITRDPGRLSAAWYAEVCAAGVEPEELVELTSVLSLVTIGDSLSRALSLPKRPLPAAEPGEPCRRSIPGARVERGWVPMVDPETAEGMTKTLYEGIEASAGFVFNVARALSAVPEALRDFFTAFFPNYTTHGPVRSGGLSRTQVELLASTTSAYNDCFY